jgi:hypoxanthine phosphoribosyltransferase
VRRVDTAWLGAAQTEAEIDLSCRFVAAELNAKFRGQHIVLCGILKGVYVFLSDLTKHLTIPYSVYFVEASSYGDKQQAGELQFMSQLVPSKFHNRKVM